MSLGIVYGSSTGNTENVANEIKSLLQVDADVLDIANVDVNQLNEYDKLIIGTSTWGDGDLQDDWEDVDLEALEVSGKTVALFGLGDQEAYPDNFCTAMGIIYEALKGKGANVVGAWSTEGYEFDSSDAVVDDKFVGLALDEDNQEDMSQTRISAWVESIKADFV